MYFHARYRIVVAYVSGHLHGSYLGACPSVPILVSGRYPSSRIIKVGTHLLVVPHVFARPPGYIQ